jgi:hypothetical protein
MQPSAQIWSEAGFCNKMIEAFAELKGTIFDDGNAD